MTKALEYYTFQKMYGKDYIEKTFRDFKSYKYIRTMNTFQEVADELSFLDAIN